MPTRAARVRDEHRARRAPTRSYSPDASSVEPERTYPGQLWLLQRRPVVLCGNVLANDGTVWCMRWSDGERVNPLFSALTPHPKHRYLYADDLEYQFHQWALDGNRHAMWWLAWWFEGTNHPKSIWYYVAAMRAGPRSFGWAQGRVMSDARSACMCEGVPKPDLTFLGVIPEMQGEPIGDDWKSAVATAYEAVHKTIVAS